MTKLREVSFVTGNQNKLLELQRMLGMMIKQRSLELPEILSLEVSTAAKKKAEAAYEKIQSPVLVESAGLTVNAWGDFPGALIEGMVGSKYRNMKLEEFCRIVPDDNRTATAVSYFCLYDGRSWYIGIGKVKGTIAKQPLGRHGADWDPVFIPNGQPKTFGEMTPMSKDKFSPRLPAIADLKAHLS